MIGGNERELLVSMLQFDSIDCDRDKWIVSASVFILLVCTDVVLVVGYEPAFDVPIVNVTVVTGQTAVLPCSIDYLGKYKVSNRSSSQPNPSQPNPFTAESFPESLYSRILSRIP